MPRWELPGWDGVLAAGLTGAKEDTVWENQVVSISNSVKKSTKQKSGTEPQAVIQAGILSVMLGGGGEEFNPKV
jgi:hypothetical protein